MLDDKDGFENNIINKVLWEVSLIVGINNFTNIQLRKLGNRFAVRHLSKRLKNDWREQVDEELRERGLL